MYIRRMLHCVLQGTLRCTCCHEGANHLNMAAWTLICQLACQLHAHADKHTMHKSCLPWLHPASKHL